MVSENTRKFLRVAVIQPSTVNQSTEDESDEVWSLVEAKNPASCIIQRIFVL
jgi:hypothetical protein